MKTLKQVSLFVLVLIAVLVLFHTVGSKKVSARQPETRRVAISAVQTCTPHNPGSHTKSGIRRSIPLPGTITASGASGSGISVASLNGSYTLAAGVDNYGNQYYVEASGGNYGSWVASTGLWWFSDRIAAPGQGLRGGGTSYAAGPVGAYPNWAGNPAPWASSTTMDVAAVTTTSAGKSRITTCIY